ncbi:Mu homology domain-containing protein [Entophlyctis helioformis]|nr:Mu homology domain-containing protein [Entophlyctis helioformis]
MLSAIFVFNAKGDVLISRMYRTDVKRSASDLFRIHVISSTDHENIFLVAVSRTNPNTATVYEFLYKIVRLGKAYFGKLNEEAVKSNFTLIYELLDEICDFGFPQNTEAETLKQYITTEGIESERALDEGSRIAIQATGAVSWRRPDIKYRKNEAFVDVIESINLIMSAKGTVLRSDVSAQIVMRAYLSGMPECKIGLNDKVLLDKEGKNTSGPSRTGSGRNALAVELDDCQFHQCVKLGRFDSDRTINFIPPDGEFELMRYRTTENISLPFKVHAVVNELSATRVEFRIAVRSQFSSRVYAQNIVVKIPTPLNTASTKIVVSAGRAKYNGSENSIVWKIARFQGQEELLISAEAELTSTTVKKTWSRPPISLDFQVLMFTASGLMVRFLKIFEKSNYQSVKWVRYMTKAGSYQIRVGSHGRDALVTH